jgi:hypothetical protein
VRLAAYWTPPTDGALWRFACRWLGRDAASGELFPCRDARHAAITEDARRYGFHATLKAPIALADGATLDDVRTALRALAARFTPFTTPPWVLADIDGFLAMVPDPMVDAGRPKLLHALADASVLALEPLRRPATPAELARRRPDRLGPRARLYLERYGYPWVLEEFFAHLTLTCRLDTPEREATTARLQRELAALPAAPFAFHDICLFVEESPGAPFRLLERFPLGVQR